MRRGFTEIILRFFSDILHWGCNKNLRLRVSSNDLWEKNFSLAIEIILFRTHKRRGDMSANKPFCRKMTKKQENFRKNYKVRVLFNILKRFYRI